ncbi:TetR family transcriptional regulator [Pseudarthrobacter sulfonivorans]|uniref:TetR family transcriptional regulator n=1 Tax=Pseudarthrobacter sulfonivorans TaxID=121292 RepID=A0A0U3PGE2_9MICC|nr:TetR/AcrR family transcriptional regulator [Pseudarthrobacter sulfonivorans]ALV41400.1 TetR family transcriptional regulator [Pseudarthrobacter sulfonivorans]
MTGNKGALRQAALLDAAEEVLAAKGNAGSAMRDFAAAAGVRVGHLQHYFPTRADLIRAVLDRSLQRSLQRLNDMSGIGVGDGPGAGESLTREHSERLIAALLAEHSDPAGIGMHVEVWAIASADEQIAAAVRAFYARYALHVADLVQQTRPELAKKQRDAVAGTIVSLFEGAAVTRSGIGGLRTEDTDAELIRTAQWLIHGA